jgi:hypothetical protein
MAQYPSSSCCRSILLTARSNSALLILSRRCGIHLRRKLPKPRGRTNSYTIRAGLLPCWAARRQLKRFVILKSATAARGRNTL